MGGASPWLLTLLTLAGTAEARDRALLWSVEGEHNVVFLLGSIHVLRPQDGGLTPAVEAAYDEAERLLMEIDMDEAGLGDAASLLGVMQQAALLPSGRTLRGELGEEYAALAAQAREHGIDFAIFDRFAPWFVAMLLVQRSLHELGFDPGLGVEQQLATRAAEDAKAIDGLETPAEQFALFAGLDREQQRAFLRETLADLEHAQRDADELLAAWRSGDEAELTRLLEEEQSRAPELYGPLTVERNRAWLDHIESLLDDRDDWLVVVGAMHLVGRDSVVDLLRRRGRAVERR